MTSSLWKPDKQTRVSIVNGSKKANISGMKYIGVLEETRCKYCFKEILVNTESGRLLTLTGSNHKCKNMEDL